MDGPEWIYAAFMKPRRGTSKSSGESVKFRSYTPDEEDEELSFDEADEEEYDRADESLTEDVEGVEDDEEPEEYEKFEDEEEPEEDYEPERDEEREEDEGPEEYEEPEEDEGPEEDEEREEDEEPEQDVEDEEIEEAPPPSPRKNTAQGKENCKSSSPPVCNICLTGARYRKNFEFTIDKNIDDAIYRVLKCLDDECIDIRGMHLKGERNPTAPFFYSFLAPFAACLFNRPLLWPPKRRRPNCGCCRCRPKVDSFSHKRKTKRSPRRSLVKRNGRTKPVPRRRYRNSLRDGGVLIEICPSKMGMGKYKKKQERGVGTDTFPELEYLLREDVPRCVAKMTGMHCKCRVCTPKSEKKKDSIKPKQVKKPQRRKKTTKTSKARKKTYEDKEKTYRREDRTRSESASGSYGTRRSKKSRVKKDRMKYQRTFSLFLNSDPMRDSDNASSVPVLHKRPKRQRMNSERTRFLRYSPKSKPLNIYSALQQWFPKIVDVQNSTFRVEKQVSQDRLDKIIRKSPRKSEQSPYTTTSRERKTSRKPFLERYNLLELQETSENVEDTVNDQNTECRAVCTSLNLHKLFQRSLMHNVSSSASSISETTRLTPGNETSRPNTHKQRDVTNDRPTTVLRSNSREFTSKMGSNHSMTCNDVLSVASPPKEAFHLETSKLFLKKLPSLKKSTNILPFLKDHRSDIKQVNSKTTTVDKSQANHEKTRQCMRHFEKLKIFLRRTKKIKSKHFLPVTLDKKQGMLDLSYLKNESS